MRTLDRLGVVGVQVLVVMDQLDLSGKAHREHLRQAAQRMFVTVEEAKQFIRQLLH